MPEYIEPVSIRLRVHPLARVREGCCARQDDDTRLNTVRAGLTNWFGRTFPFLATASVRPAGSSPHRGALDAHVEDVVLTILPRLDVGSFGFDDGAEVLAVEHQDVRQASLGIEVNDRL